jgi:hypothetical protein
MHDASGALSLSAARDRRRERIAGRVTVDGKDQLSSLISI